MLNNSLYSIEKNEGSGARSLCEKTAPLECATSSNLNRRKLNLLRHSGFFGFDLKGCVIERAYGAADLRAAYQLVHNVFVGTGYIEPEAGCIRLRIFEASPDTATFVAKKNGEVVGVLSVVMDSVELGLPSDTAFGAELDELRATGLRICEVTNQAVVKEYRRSSVLTELMRCAIAYMVKADCGQALATVSPNHQKFYKMVGFKSFGTLRSYSKKLHDPVVAVSLPVDLYRSEIPAPDIDPYIHHMGSTGNPFMDRAEEWTVIAKESFLCVELLDKLLNTGRNFLSECSPAEHTYLQCRWGGPLFERVFKLGNHEKLVASHLISSI